MMKTTLAAAAVALTVIAGSASATTVPSIGTNASYDGFFTANNAYPDHGLWLPDLLKDSKGKSLSRHWSVDSSASTAYLRDDKLTLSGVVTNIEDTSLQLSYSLNFRSHKHMGGAACGNSSTGANSCNSTDATDVAERKRMRFFDLDTTVASGISGLGALSGLSLTFAIKPDNLSKPPQLGFGGNWRNMEFGYSNWFMYSTNTSSIAGYSVAASGSGDVNQTFTDNENDSNNVPPVPLPAGLPLMLAALGAFGFMRRRQGAK